MRSHRWPAYFAVAGFTTVALAVVVLELIALAGWMGWHPTRASTRAAMHARTTIHAVQPTVARMQSRVHSQASPQPAAAVLPPRPEDGYYDQLRTRIRWVSTRIGEDKLPTPDPDSRMLLVKSAAQRAGLHEVGLGFQDVYGIINAETSWVPRTGASKDGTPNLGIAQFEPATAKLLGVRNPDDPVESVHVAAQHMKEAALWSQARIAGLKLGADERAARLREGVSIYYNLSSRGRAAWNGRNTKKLPRETQLHIYNARLGAQQADILERSVLTASN